MNDRVNQEDFFSCFVLLSVNLKAQTPDNFATKACFANKSLDISVFVLVRGQKNPAMTHFSAFFLKCVLRGQNHMEL